MSGIQSLAGVMVAAIILIVIADYAPHLVNWVLVLILAGVVLKRSNQWVPILQGLGGTQQSQQQKSG